MVREWNPQPKSTWVTCLPSLRHPDLVPNFAKRLAAALGLPFHMVIAKTDDRPEQKTMANSRRATSTARSHSTVIRPFLSVPDVGKRGAGVLRDKPKNLHWETDPGKDDATAPWYDLGLQYGGKVGDRINDHHLTLADKRAARAKQGKS